jgi:hypothetical protein
MKEIDMTQTNKKPMMELVKNEEWQKVRKSLLGQWKNRPEWCCNQLRKYMGSVSSTSDDKLRILINYLTGTGFRSGLIKPPCVIKLRGEISAEMKKRKFKE